jgi:tetratricopeptide (TPR) repeat protein
MGATAKTEGRYAAAAFYLTKAIDFKRKTPLTVPQQYNLIISRLYSEKADIYQLADYNQYFNLWIAVELRRLAFERFPDEQTAFAYAIALTLYAELLEKNYELEDAQSYVNRALQIGPLIPYVHYVKANISDLVFQVYDALSHSKEACFLATNQRDTTLHVLYKPQHDRFNNFFIKNGLPDPIKSKSKKEEFIARIVRAQNETENIRTELIQQPEFRPSELNTLEKRTERTEKNVKNIETDLDKAAVKEREELLKRIETLNDEIADLKRLIALATRKVSPK